jgi:hypothetical protein
LGGLYLLNFLAYSRAKHCISTSGSAYAKVRGKKKEEEQEEEEGREREFHLNPRTKRKI